MTESSLNFGFLDPFDRSLHEAAAMAEQHLRGDPVAACVRLRLFVERLSARLATRNKLQGIEALDLIACLDALGKRSVLPRAQLDAAHRIRKDGNEAAHEGCATGEQAISRLRDAHGLAVWYVREVLGRKDVVPGRFEPPPPPVQAAPPVPPTPPAPPGLPDRFAPVRAARQRLQAALTELADIAAKGDEEDLGRRCAQAAAQLDGQEFTVAVLGEFKAGKTTLVNALCGRAVLPTATLECTAVVTVIHGATPERTDTAVLTRASGNEVVVNLDHLEDSLTVRSTRDTTDPAELADLWLSGVPLLRHGIALVDTPGLNAAGLARERATLEFLPRADAVVFVTRADRLLTETEVTFLRERLLAQNLARLFLVVNRADALKTDADRAEVLRRAHDLLDPLVGGLRLHLVCAEDAVVAIEDDHPGLLEASGVPAFQQALETFLVEHRAQAELTRAVVLARAFRSDVSQRLRERREVAAIDGQLAERRRERIRAWMGYAREDEAAVVEILRDRLGALRRGPMQRVCEDSRARLEEKLTALRLEGEQVEEARARALVDSVGGQALTQLQAALGDGLPPIQQEISARIQLLFDKADLNPNALVARRALAPMDFGTLVRVSSSQESRPVSAPTPAAAQPASSESFGVAAAVGGLIGAAIAGPFGAAVGAFLGAALVGEVSRSQPATMRSLTEVFTRKRINARQTALDFQQRLEQGASDALGALRAEMEGQIRGLVREKTRTLQRQLDDLDTGPGGDRAGLVRLEAAIGRLDALHLDGHGAEA